MSKNRTKTISCEPSEWTDLLVGSTVAYRITPDRNKSGELDITDCDFCIDLMQTSFPKQLRDPRRRRNNGIRYKKSQRSLVDDLVVLFGPKVSAREAAEMLHDLSEKIRREGLFVRIDDDWQAESAVDGRCRSV